LKKKVAALINIPELIENETHGQFPKSSADGFFRGSAEVHSVLLRNCRGLFTRIPKTATAFAGHPLATPSLSSVRPNSPKSCWPNTSDTTTTRPLFDSSISTDSKRSIPTIMRFAFRTNTSGKISRRVTRNLLHLIKRNKHPFEVKAQKGNKEYKDYLALKEEMDELRRRNSQIEEYLNSMIVQNGKILDDNKYLCMEILKAR
jgi:hypothetical protein